MTDRRPNVPEIDALQGGVGRDALGDNARVSTTGVAGETASPRGRSVHS